MSAAVRAGNAPGWLAAAGRRGGLRAHAGGGRRDDRQARSTVVVIAFSLFFLLMVGGLLIGGRAVIDPLLQSAAEAREANRTAEIVFPMPDGTFCRYMSFDNATAQVAFGDVTACPADIRGRSIRPRRAFAWGNH